MTPCSSRAPTCRRSRSHDRLVDVLQPVPRMVFQAIFCCPSHDCPLSADPVGEVMPQADGALVRRRGRGGQRFHRRRGAVRVRDFTVPIGT